MFDEWLMRQIELKNFGAIYAQVVKDNSLSMFCGVVADAVYKEINNPDGDCDFCLCILQAMLDKGWRWSEVNNEIHRLLPLRFQLDRFGVPVANRDRYYGSERCVKAALSLGTDMTPDDLVVQAILGDF